MIRASLYDAKGEDREIDVTTGPPPRISKDRLLWIELVGRSDPDLCRLQDLLGLDARVLEGLRNSNGPLTLNNYGDHFHCSVIALNPSEAKKENGPPLPTGVHLDFVIGKDWLVTAAAEELQFSHEFRERDRGETVIGALTSGTLAASLLDWHLTSYLTALEELEAWLDVLDVRLIASKAADMSLLKSIVSSRRYVSRMRRNLAPQRAVFYGLARPDFPLVSESEAKDAFEALEHRFDRVLDSVEHIRELVQGSFDLFSTRVNESTNVLIRRLTFVSIMLGTIGAVAGVFGMNFETPYTNSGTIGFWIVVGGLLVLGVVGLIVGLIRKWI